MMNLLAAGLAASLGLGIGLAAAPAQAASSDGRLVNDEIVVSSLDPTGLPIRSQLVSRLTSAGGPVRTVHDPTATTNIEYLNQRGRPVVKGDGIQVQVGGPQPQTVLTQGLVNKVLPVALHAEYTLNGEVVDPGVVVGASGELKVAYTVTNTDIEKETLTYKDANGSVHTEKTPVFAPYIGTLTVTLPPSFEVRDTPGATIATNDEGATLLTWNLVLYPPLGDYQQTVKFSAAVDPGSIPKTVLEVMPVTTTQDPAVEFSADMLSKSVEGNEKLGSGLEQINSSTVQLAQAAAQLSNGIAQLASGTAQVSTGFSSQLVPGTQGLASGAAQLAAGQSQLSTALGQAATGADQLTSGADQLATGLGQLADGLKAYSGDAMPQLDSGADALAKGAKQLSAAVGSPDDPPLPTPSVSVPTPSPIPTPGGSPVFPTPTPTPTLTFTPTLIQVLNATVSASRLLTKETVTLSNDLLDLNASLAVAANSSQQANQQAGDTESALTTFYASVCPPPGPLTPQQCDALQSAQNSAAQAATSTKAVQEQVSEAAQAAAIESVRAYAIALGSNDMQDALKAIQAGLDQVSLALSSGSSKPGQQGLVEGLDQLSTGLSAATTAADQLSSGAAQAGSGASQLASGNAQLAGGLGQAATGSQGLATGSQQLASGASQLAFGSEQVAQALGQLAGGADQAANGTAEFADGVDKLQKEGTQKIYESVVKSSAQPALANAYLQAANKRAGDALPYGPPKGATGSAAYMFTMDPVEQTNNAGWALAALGLIGVAAVGGAVLKSLHANRAPA